MEEAQVDNHAKASYRILGHPPRNRPRGFGPFGFFFFFFFSKMDEMAHEDWTNPRTAKACSVPATVEQDSEFSAHFVGWPDGSRRSQTIGVNGASLKPTVIILRKTVDPDLASTRLTKWKSRSPGSIVLRFFSSLVTCLSQSSLQSMMFGF
jgi:hypothetical protein